MDIICCFCEEYMGTVDGQGEVGPSHGAHPECLERHWGIRVTGKGLDDEVARQAADNND